MKLIDYLWKKYPYFTQTVYLVYLKLKGSV